MKILEMKWTISKARDTYGYNKVTLIDGNNKYIALGGGYDMQGTVFGEWLFKNYEESIKSNITPIDYDNDNKREGMYGFFTKNGKYWLDGKCGLNCMIQIARKIGLEINYSCHKGDIDQFIIQDKEIKCTNKLLK